MRRIEGAIRPYAWGSRTVLATMQGRRVPSQHPEAELWFGTHPGDPARLTDGSGDLRELVAADPLGQLGRSCRDEYDGALPYLVKVLAADEPLSLQAHPSRAQAVEGFERENRAGLALDSAERNYRDPNHKPEVVVALSRFEALAGFREPTRTLRLLRALRVPQLEQYLSLLSGQPDAMGLRALLTTWITLPHNALGELVGPVLDGCVRLLADPAAREFRGEAELALNLGERYPDDAGLLAALLLNRVVLEPGQALFLPAGNLHAYVSGVAVEVMANSDNVLRGGLTPKHVDVPELLRVLDFEPRTPEELAPPVSSLGAELIYHTPMPEFRVSRICLDATGLHRPEAIELDARGPQLLVVTSGVINVRERNADGDPETADVRAGSGLWMPADGAGVQITARSTDVEIFRTLVGDE
jgi:mannose-6-phosphate isomerase